MSRETIFNKQLSIVLNIVEKNCPGDSDTARSRNGLIAMKRLGPKLPLVSAGGYLNRYAKQILSGDISFFLDNNTVRAEDYAKDAGYSVDELSELFNKMRMTFIAMDDADQKEIITACQTMVKLYQAEMRDQE